MLRAVFWFWSVMNTTEYRLTPAMKVQIKDYSFINGPTEDLLRATAVRFN